MDSNPVLVFHSQLGALGWALVAEADIPVGLPRLMDSLAVYRRQEVYAHLVMLPGGRFGLVIVQAKEQPQSTA